jgi:pimeloyl-ACP methyl ester carboxylesterase
MGFAEIGGLKIHYRAVGDPTSKKGQGVIYVHGTGRNSSLWQKHMESLADSHRPVAIDLPGHGQSEGRGFRGAADHGEFVVELAKSLGWDRVVVAGHSLGGAVALTTALYHAEMVAGLVLIDTGARLRVHPDILKSHREAAAAGRRTELDRSWAFSDKTPQSLVDEVKAMCADTDPWVTYVDWVCDDTSDFMSRVEDIDVPTLAVCGEEDRLTPVKYHRFFQDRMPQCELAIIQNAGHYVYMEQPAEFNRVVKKFLDTLPMT